MHALTFIYLGTHKTTATFLLSSLFTRTACSTTLHPAMLEAIPSLISNVLRVTYTHFTAHRNSIPTQRTKNSWQYRLSSAPAPLRRTSLYIGIQRYIGLQMKATAPKLSPESTTSRVRPTTDGTTVSLMLMLLERPRHSHPTSATSPLAVTLEQTMVGRPERICSRSAATSSMAKRPASRGTDWNFQRRPVTSWASLLVSYK